jgi:hypothetical protein
VSWQLLPSWWLKQTNYSETKTHSPSSSLCFSWNIKKIIKIRDKGKIVSAGYGGDGREREGEEWVLREGVGAGGRNDPSLVCTYE